MLLPCLTTDPEPEIKNELSIVHEVFELNVKTLLPVAIFQMSLEADMVPTLMLPPRLASKRVPEATPEAPAPKTALFGVAAFTQKPKDAVPDEEPQILALPPLMSHVRPAVGVVPKPAVVPLKSV